MVKCWNLIGYPVAAHLETPVTFGLRGCIKTKLLIFIV
jgi:hypothetical protein